MAPFDSAAASETATADILTNDGVLTCKKIINPSSVLTFQAASTSPVTSGSFVVTFDNATNIFTKTGHGLGSNAIVSFTGSTGYALTFGTTGGPGDQFYVKILTNDTFQIKETRYGAVLGFNIVPPIGDNNIGNVVTATFSYNDSDSQVIMDVTGQVVAIGGVSTPGSVTTGAIISAGDVSINANLNFDRGTNDTTKIKFTSSTEIDNVRRQTPIIHVGDIETAGGGGAGGRMGFDFKFREGGINSLTYTLFRAYSTSTTGNGQFQVFGSTFSTQSTWGTSDDRFKHGEYNIANGLETIRQLVPQTYKKTIKMLDEQNDGTNIGTEGEDWHWESGLIAQEVEQIPTLSKYVKDLDDAKYVSYNSIHVHTISAVKELDTIVQQQALLINSLEARLLALESK